MTLGEEMANQPSDDLTDDVTVAADSDLVEEIRRQAAALRDPHPVDVRDDPDTVTGSGDLGDLVDDDVTMPATSSHSSVKRRPLPAAPVPSMPSREPSLVADEVDATPPEGQRVKKVTPTVQPVAPSFASPFLDDGVSLIEQRDAAPLEQAWEPPARFGEEQPKPRAVATTFGLGKMAAVVLAVIVLTAIATAFIVLAVTGAGS